VCALGSVLVQLGLGRSCKEGRVCTGMSVGTAGAGQVMYKEGHVCIGLSVGTAGAGQVA
jgi:hypothetical protein